MTKPLLSDIELQKHAFQPGDRLLVRIGSPLDDGQAFKLVRAVKKFAREDVRVLVWPCNDFYLRRTRGQLLPVELAGPMQGVGSPMSGVANVQCTVEEFQPGDLLVVEGVIPGRKPARGDLDVLVEWAGPGVEVVTL